MEGGRFLLAIALMIAVVVLTNVLLPPARPAPALVDPGPDTVSAAAPVSPGNGAPAPPPGALPGTVMDTADPRAHADTIRVASELYDFGVSTRGGTIVSARLLRHLSYRPGSEGTPAELVPADAPGIVRHRLQVGTQVVDLDALDLRPDARRVEVDGAGDATRTLRLAHRDSASGFGIELTYTFRADDYAFDVALRPIGLAGTTPQLLIDLGPRIAANEAVAAEDERALAYVVRNEDTGIASVSLGKVRAQSVENGPLTWFAIKSKYFVATVMRTDQAGMPFGGVIATPTAEPLNVDLTATLLPDQSGEFRYRVYLGPQEFDRLAAFQNQLQDVSVFGWKFLQPVLRPLGHAITWALLQMHRVLGLGYGWVLVLFGILVRIVLWPLNAKAMRASMKNMEMQPRIKEIQARYKAEPEKLQKEMLRLYKEEGFNPAGGCLPMLIPFPVLIALFFVFQSTIEFRGVEFLWLPDLSRADPLYILPVALGLSMFIQQWLTLRATKDAQPQMKIMTYVMPIFLTVLFLNFASGLNLYYASMNLASVPQQLQINKERQRRFGQPRPA